jgi:hypothetical protein
LHCGGIWTLKEQDKSRIRADIFLAKQKKNMLFDYERNHDTPKELKKKQFRKKSIT